MLPTPPPADVPVLVVYEQAVTGARTHQQLLSFLGAMGKPEARFEDDSRPGLVGLFPPVEAFERTYDHDAHFVQYGLFETDGKPCVQGWSRINKELAPPLAEAGALVRQVFVGVDLDTEGHKAWGPDCDPSVYVPLLVQALAKDPPLQQWWAFHLTQKGARLVYRLLVPVHYQDVEGHIRGLLNRLVATGLGASGKAIGKKAPEIGTTFFVDFDGSSDWTRLIRLPRVVRDGVSHHSTEIAFQREARLDLVAIPPVGKPTTIALQKFQGEMPAEDDVEINFDKDGKWFAWKKLALRTLANTEVGLVAAGKKQLVEGDGSGPSGRNDAIVRHAGQAVSRLYQLTIGTDDVVKALTGPETIYGLLLPAVKQFAPDEHSRLSWPQVLWDATVRMWEKEATKHVTLVQKKAEDEAKTNVSIVEGFGRWCDDPAFKFAASMSEKLEYVKRRLVVTAGGGAYYVLRDDGYYRHDSVGKDVLIATMRSEGLDKVIDFEWQNEDGNTVELSEGRVLRRHTMPITMIDGAPRSDVLPGGKLTRLGDELVLTVPLFGLRTDIQPEYNVHVDGWLRSFNHEELIEFIQKALDFTIPIPLTAVIGPPSIGKQLIVRGLQECVTTQALATDRDFGTFSPKLMRSPFLLINEDVEERIGGKETSALIRQYTAGDGIEVNRKYKNPIDVNNAMRVIVTANNIDVLMRLLGQNKDLTPDDRDALALRVVHLPTSDAPAKYLEGLGAFAFTSKEGARWVRGVDGSPSDHIVAKHFLWIHQQKRFPANVGGRFSMKGKLPAELMYQLSTGGGSSALVVKTLLAMIEGMAMVQQAPYGLVVSPPKAKDRIFVTAGEVVNYYNARLQDKTKKTLGEKQVGLALQGLRAPGSNNHARFVEGVRDKKNRWNEVLLSTLLMAATEHGFKSDHLIKLARAAGVAVESENEAT